MRAAAAVALALLAPAVARADIPVPPQVLYGAFGPRKIQRDGEQRWRPIEVGFRVGPAPAVVEDPRVRVVSREVRIDVYLGVAVVHEHTVLSADPPARDVTVGFLQERGRERGVRVFGLAVTVDGEEAAVARGGSSPPPGRELLQAIVGSSDGVWTWEWSLDVDERTEVDIRHVVALDLRGSFDERDHAAAVGYELGLARAWRGGLGPTTVTVESHGPLEVRSLDGSALGARTEARARPDQERLLWLVGLDDDAFVRRYCPERALRYPERWLGWVDRLAQARHCGGLDPDEADALVEDLRVAAVMMPGRQRDVARGLLASIGRQVRRARPPLEEDEQEVPEWIDGERSDPDPEWSAAIERALTSLGPHGRVLAGQDAADARDRGTKRRVHRIEPPAPIDAHTLTAFDDFVAPDDLGHPNAVVVARGLREGAPFHTALLLAALLAPFALGWLRWRARK